jgi:phosphoribosylformylglycinamidine synthase
MAETMLVKVFVTLKEGVLDPQGKAVQNSLHSLGFGAVRDVRVGKYLELHLDVPAAEDAEQQARRMCEKLLANPVIEDYRFEVAEVAD